MQVVATRRLWLRLYALCRTPGYRDIFDDNGKQANPRFDAKHRNFERVFPIELSAHSQ